MVLLEMHAIYLDSLRCRRLLINVRLYLYSCDLRANLLRCGAAAVLHVVRQRKGYCVVSAACSPAVVANAGE